MAKKQILSNLGPLIIEHDIPAPRPATVIALDDVALDDRSASREKRNSAAAARHAVTGDHVADDTCIAGRTTNRDAPASDPAATPSLRVITDDVSLNKWAAKTNTYAGTIASLIGANHIVGNSGRRSAHRDAAPFTEVRSLEACKTVRDREAV